jgi:hypothetical protein
VESTEETEAGDIQQEAAALAESRGSSFLAVVLVTW